jgi:organic radical activating enzyme
MVVLRMARNSDGAAEVFRSVQGEGRNVGRVRTFVRLSGCNLHCAWCDTAYTWNWLGTPFAHRRDAAEAPHKFAVEREMVKHEVGEVADMVDALAAEGVVISGGEPLMQMTGVAALIAELRRRRPGLAVEIETNGSIAPSEALVREVDLFMVSPKIGHSGNDPAVALNPEALATFAALDKATFKVVAETVEDVAAIAALADRYGIARQRVYVMPEGVDSRTILDRGAQLIDAVIAAGFNYSDRLHIHLFGPGRGK